MVRKVTSLITVRTSQASRLATATAVMTRWVRGQGREHGQTIGTIDRLAQNVLIEHHAGVGAQHAALVIVKFASPVNALSLATRST